MRIHSSSRCIFVSLIADEGEGEGVVYIISLLLLGLRLTCDYLAVSCCRDRGAFRLAFHFQDFPALSAHSSRQSSRTCVAEPAVATVAAAVCARAASTCWRCSFTAWRLVLSTNPVEDLYRHANQTQVGLVTRTTGDRRLMLHQAALF